MAAVETISTTVQIEPLLEWATLTTASPPMISIEDLREYPPPLAAAAQLVVEEACIAAGIPFGKVITATFRDGKVDEVTLRVEG